jgi:hypothetical protein
MSKYVEMQDPIVVMLAQLPAGIRERFDGVTCFVCPQRAAAILFATVEEPGLAKRLEDYTWGTPEQLELISEFREEHFDSCNFYAPVCDTHIHGEASH